MEIKMKSQISNIIKNFVNDTKKILKDNLIAEYLFGSYSRNEQTELSDIDILNIVKQFNSQVRSEISALSSDYSLEKEIIISPIIKSISVWEKNKKYNTLFYTEIERDGIKL